MNKNKITTMEVKEKMLVNLANTLFEQGYRVSAYNDNFMENEPHRLTGADFDKIGQIMYELEECKK